jgi:hypothetical protein
MAPTRAIVAGDRKPVVVGESTDAVDSLRRRRRLFSLQRQIRIVRTLDGESIGACWSSAVTLSSSVQVVKVSF